MYDTRMLSPAITAPTAAPLHAAAIGRFQSHGGFRWEQVSKHTVLHCVRDGRGAFIDNGETFPAGAGDVFLFRPGRHYQYFDRDSAPWRYDFVMLSGVGEDDVATLLGSAGPLFALGLDHVFWNRLDDAIPLYEQRVLPLVTACRVNWEFLEALGHRLPQPIRRDLGARVREYLERLDTEFPTVNELAFRFEVDRATLFRCFRAASGVSVKNWIDAERFRRAQALLRVSDAPVREVARLCGFRDPLYFSRAFRQRFGVAPSAWRQSRKAEASETPRPVSQVDS